MDNLMSPEERRAWLRRQLAETYGFSDRDWMRIKQLAEETTQLYTPAALDDLSVPWRVGAAPPGCRRHSSGRQIGTWNGCAVLVWAMSERERASWAKRVGNGA